jgi:signal transduction histidine kinase/ActR/RegA family two-component response regulator
MTAIQPLQFSTRLLLAIAGLTAGSLVLVGVIMSFTVYAAAKQEMTHHQRVQCGMMAEAVSGAVAFTDSKATAELLGCADADPTLLLAAAYDAEGALLSAHVARTSQLQPPARYSPSEAFWRDSDIMVTTAAINAAGESIGTLVMVSDVRPIERLLLKQIGTGLIIILLAIGFAMFAASRIAATLVLPITRLAQLAHRVAHGGDYSVRAVKVGDDEVGVLTDAFNGMLTHIQDQNQTLVRSNDELEQRVEARTRELAEQARQVALARDAAEAASRAKSDFLANMSHEIRTPMTAILGYADLLVDPSQAESQRIEHIQTVRRNGEHLMAIINDILDISKIEAGAMTVEQIELDPIAMVRDSIELMQVRARAKGLELSAEFGLPLPARIESDPVRLRQILVNLIGNAIKFTEQGSVRVIVEADPTARSLRFKIADSGIGMSPEQVSKLFRPFTQADDTMTRRYGGTGLGLAISQRLSQMLGGDVVVESTLGVGTTFTISIDAGDGAFERLAHELPALPKATSTQGTTRLMTLTARVLLAEDGPDNQRLISFHLRKAGATVDVAENGKVAIDRIKQATAAGTPYDVIFMDMQMPELDGYSATAALRLRGCTLPIIALTAHAMASDREKCLAAGCDDYLTKPIARDDLIAACSKWAAGRICGHATAA